MSAIEASTAAPNSIGELVDFVRAAPRVVALGADTKPRLGAVAPEYTRIAMKHLRGIVEYEPSEFTFTALAGTPVRDLVAALAERGQYLPFDPLLVNAGATLGGTIASGLHGPGRVRYGGLRDFILGVKLVDGAGRLLRLGGKVVKNAAGFDVPKFLVGSAGRFGIVAEATFKVFPRPVAVRTLRLEVGDDARKPELMITLSAGRWEFDAIDAAVGERAIFARLAGAPEAVEALSRDVLRRWSGAAMTSGDADLLWQSVTELRWAHAAGTLVKVALRPRAVTAFIGFVREQSEARGWVSGAGNIGYISWPKDTKVPRLPWPAITLRGTAPLYPGVNTAAAVFARVKHALDPNGKFPPIEPP